MDKLDNLRQMTVGMMDLHYGVNRLEEAKKDFKMNLRIAIISCLILAVICVGIMYLKFRILGK